MKTRFFGRLGLLLVVISLVSSSVPAQTTTTGRLTGTVTDAQGALVAKARITVKDVQTNAEFKVTANDEGGWTIPSINNGVYTVTITAPGFKSTVVQNVKVDTGVTATVNATLEVGGTTEQVVVTSGGSVIQSESANISSTIVGRQIGELPWATRDAMQLVLTLPGVQTPGTPRTSSVNGLPKSSLNITLDGANIQDNLLKSSDGFFTSTQAKSDAVEEVTVSTATPGAESSGEGAVQIKFVTKSGSNEYHGGIFWQHRNTSLNSNYFFNNIDGLPRDFMILNQAGGRIGGPITIPKLFNGKDKAFFFVNYEEFRLPQVYPSPTRTVMTDSAMAGNYMYKDTAGNVRTVNLYAIAATGAGGRTYPNTPDPTVLRALGLIKEASLRGVLKERISTNSDYNRFNLNFQDPGKNIRRFPTSRFDFNVTKDHHVEFVHNYQHYFSDPDGVNTQLNVFPGAGIVVGSPGITGSIYRNNFTFALAERWTVTNSIVNEVRLTSSGNGTVVFTREFAPGLFHLYNGFAISNPFSTGYFSRSTQSRRNTPVKSINDNVNWVKGSHVMNFGAAFTRVSSFTQSVGRQSVPGVNFGIASGDPINTGATNIFTTANFPGSTAAQRGEAANLYAALTGRISSTNTFVVLDENTRKFEFVPFTEHNHQDEWGIYGQDSWKIKPNFTLNYGLRWEFQPSPVNDNLIYTRTGFEGIYGVSGPGNLFKPGVFRGAPTQYRLLEPGEKAFRNRLKDFTPSLGFAWSPNISKGILGKLLGDSGQTVLRGGYSIAYTREGFNAFLSIFGANAGPTVTLSTDPSTNPAEFGPPGSRLFRDGTYPFRPIPQPTFPFTARQGDSLNDFNPNIKAGYVQSYSFGIQREITKDTALEIRYVGNHATHLWRQYELSDVNIFENGFLNEFIAARNNLAISRAAGRGNNYGNLGLPGQVAVPIIQTAIGSTTDLTTLTSLDRGEAGRVAAAIAGNLTRMNRLITAGLVPSITVPDPNNPGATITLSNFFVVNPRSPGNSFLMDNGAGSTYNSLQVELRRRMSKGLLVQASYVFSKSLTNAFANSSVAFSQPTSLRDLEYDKGPAPRDIRHGIKVDWIHELPIGAGHRFFDSKNRVIGKLLEGWQWGGVARIQSGTPFLLTSGRLTYNNRESGVELHNLTLKQLQGMVKIHKETVCNPTTGVCQGVVYWLPIQLINNSQAAFEVAGKGPLNPNQPYIGPPTTPGKLGSRIFLYGPWQTRWDLNFMKRTRISESTNFEFRVQLLNAFNRPNFTIQDPGDNTFAIGPSSTAFGQTRSAYRDFTVSGTNDPGGRLVEFQIRLNF
ncbi:MAG TPA: carboxypeptidase regulatory-like domain-containing protein [Blastocatellia bacterium]|nr:carboxypeptidase regulatory-like domain-containing protein [Blastocatellia bacterium]